jgi:hypothetical protein
MTTEHIYLDAVGISATSSPDLKLYLHGALPRFRQIVIGLSMQNPGFNPRPVHVGFLLYKAAQEQAFL